MSYTVHGVPLIAQDARMACWYASAQMLVRWRREHTRSTERGRPDPSESPSEIARYRADNGLSLGQMAFFAKQLGLRTVAPMTPSLNAIEAWLRHYGPLWTAGRKVSSGGRSYGHVVVIVGVTSDQILIHDPEPVGVGERRWVPQSWLPVTLSFMPHTIPTNFMHYA